MKDKHKKMMIGATFLIALAWVLFMIPTITGWFSYDSWDRTQYDTGYVVVCMLTWAVSLCIWLLIIDEVE